MTGFRLRLGALLALATVGVAACGGSNGGSSSSSSAPPASTAASLTSSAATSTSMSTTATTSQSGTASSGAASSSAGTSSAAAAEITNAWTTFFSGTTPVQQKLDLLQNGQQFAPYVNSQANNPLAKQTSAQVTNVQVNGNSAQVTYNVLINNQPALTNQTGQAVLENGKWKVSDASFCALLSLQGGAPTACGSLPGVGSISPAVSPSSSG